MVEYVTAGGTAALQNIHVGLAGGIGLALAFFLFALGARPDDDDGDGRILQTVFRDGAGKEALNSAEGAAAGADNEAGGLVDGNLLFNSYHARV